jgi:hypothetical protein
MASFSDMGLRPVHHTSTIDCADRIKQLARPTVTHLTNRSGGRLTLLIKTTQRQRIKLLRLRLRPKPQSQTSGKPYHEPYVPFFGLTLSCAHSLISPIKEGS